MRKLTGLHYLYFDSNQISGFIPPEIGYLRNLVRLDLSNNKLTGELPTTLKNLTEHDHPFFFSAF